MGTAVGQYATLELLKERLDPKAQYTWAPVEDVLLGKIVDETNQWIESFTETVLAPFVYVDALFDGFRWPRGPVLERGRSLLLLRGIREVTSLEVATGTGAGYAAASGYVLRPGEYEREPGMPADRLTLTSGTFAEGYATIRLSGAGGPAAVPDHVRGVAITIAERAWLASKSGRADEVATMDPDGSMVVTRYVTAEDKRKLERYRAVLAR